VWINNKFVWSVKSRKLLLSEHANRHMIGMPRLNKLRESWAINQIPGAKFGDASYRGQRFAQGETLVEIARSYNVSQMTISGLAV
jgi:hypothetical protein